MKKLITLLLVLVLAMSLVACGGGKDKAEPVEEKTEEKTEQPESKDAEPEKEEAEDAETEEADAGDEVDITLWTYPVGKWGDSATVDSLIANFNKVNPNINVTVEYLDYTNGDDQINTAIEGGQAPDMVLEGPERLVANWGAKGLMVDLSELFDTPAGGEIYESVANACKAGDGKAYEYPMVMIAHSMAINKNKFEAADALQYLDLENHTWTTENFAKAVKAVYDSGQTDVGAIYCSGQGGDQGTRALVTNMYSGTFTNPEHTAYTADSEANVKALTELQALDGINFDASINGGEEITLFRNGTLAMSFCWNAAQQTNSENAEAGKTNDGDEIVPMLFPSDDGKTELAGGIWGFGIFDNKDEAKIAASKKFIDFMCNDDDQVKESVAASGFFPVRPTVKGVYDGTDNAEIMNVFNDKFLPSMGDYYQVIPGWATARTEWWNMLQRIGTGGDVAAEVATFVTNANAATEAE